MVATRPFQFTSLPRLSKAQAALQQSMATYLGALPLRPGFAERLAASLEAMLGEPCQIGAPALQAVSRSGLAALLPQLACLVVVGAAPTEHKLLVELDSSLAASTIEKLLGGDGRGERLQRAFTEIERGVLSFALLRLLSQFAEGWNSGHELTLTLDSFASTLDELEPIVAEASGYQLLAFRLQVGGRHAYVRVFVPDAMVTQRFGSLVPQSGATPPELQYMRQRLAALGETQVTASLQGARVQLEPKDIAAIEAGDIIVLENHQLQRGPDGITGQVFVSLGRGRNGGLSAELFLDPNQPEEAHLRILDFVTQEHPMEEELPEAAAGAPAEGGPDDNLPQTEGLLRDVDAPVVVELGRIKLNTAQVVRLRAGQILRLTRGPNDPVDLVVHGKLFARGELIEVEGELGVKLTHVAG